MKKRRKNNNQQSPVPFDASASLPEAPETLSAGDPLQDSADAASEAADAVSEAELLAELMAEENMPAAQVPLETAPPTHDPVGLPIQSSPQDLSPSLDAATEAQADGAEPLDELLAELLALEMDMASPDEPASISEPVEAAEAAPVPEPPVEAPDALPAFALEAAPEPPAEIASLIAEPLIPAAEVSYLQDAPAPLHASQEASHTPLLAEEPTVLEEPSSLEDPAWVEMPAFETSEMTSDVDDLIEPLPPQPALEAIVGTIDRALESAPAVIAPVETPATHHKQFSQLDDYIVFSLSGSDYAVPVRDVAEIGRIPSVTRIPNVPDFVRGITNLRGEVVPVLNLPSLLGLQDTAPTARGRIVFLQARDPISPTGLIVDEVKGIQRIQSQQLEQVTGLVDDKVTSVLRGVHGRGERLLNVLDLEQLFQLDEVRDLAVR